METNIEAEYRLWLSPELIIGSSYRRDDHDYKRDDFVKLTMDVDVNRSKTVVTRKSRVFFVDVVFFFRHSQQGKRRVLALLRVWKTTFTKKVFPYIEPKARSEFVVTSPGDIGR